MTTIPIDVASSPSMTDSPAEKLLHADTVSRETLDPLSRLRPQFFAAAVAPAGPTTSALVIRALLLLVLGGSCVGAVALLLQSFPPLTQCADLSFNTLAWGAAPKLVGGDGDVMAAAARAWRCAAAAHRETPERTLAVYVSLYCGLQAFAIPGPLILSIVAGALYGMWWGQLLIALCATAGATLCYCLSAALARPLIEKYFPSRVADLRSRVDKHREARTLPSFMLFLRLTPAVPNWFINAAAPIVGVPPGLFVGTTCLGLLAPNYFHAAAGAALAVAISQRVDADNYDVGAVASSQNSSLGSWRQFAILLGLQAVVLVPLILLRRRVVAVVEASAGGVSGGKTS